MLSSVKSVGCDTSRLRKSSPTPIPNDARRILASLPVSAPKSYQPLRPITCVYMLILGNEVVYVGQTIDLAAKITSHVNERTKAFDRISYVECEDLDIVEAALIDALQPRYNGKWNKRNRDYSRYRAIVFSAVDFLDSKGESGATMDEIIAEICEANIWWPRDFASRIACHPDVKWDQATLRFYSIRRR